MRKTGIVVFAMMLSMFAISCKKTYTCVCTEDSYSFHQYQNRQTRIEDVKSKSENAARKACISKNSEALDDDGSGHTTICDLVN